MITRNAFSKLPSTVLTYLLISRGIFAAVLAVIAGVLFSMGGISGTAVINGVSTPTTFSAIVPAIVLLAFGAALIIYTILWYSTFSYVIAEESITINFGVVFKQSRSIDFSKIQNVNNSRGPLQMMFGLTAVNIWTSSPGQISFSTTKNGTTSHAKPEGKLFLLAQDAEELRTIALNKGNVQNVQVISTTTQ